MRDLFIKGKRVENQDLFPELLKIKERKCECCGLKEWLGKPIPLEIHHISGDRLDSTLENLQLLCPNCHAQTESWRGKKKALRVKDEDIIKEISNSINIREVLMKIGLSPDGGNYARIKKLMIKYNLHFKPIIKPIKEIVIKPKRIKKIHYCLDCGKEISEGALRCKECNNKRFKKSIPSKEELLSKLKELRFLTKTASYYNISTMLLENWCKELGIDYYKRKFIN